MLFKILYFFILSVLLVWALNLLTSTFHPLYLYDHLEACSWKSFEPHITSLSRAVYPLHPCIPLHSRIFRLNTCIYQCCPVCVARTTVQDRSQDFPPSPISPTIVPLICQIFACGSALSHSAEFKPPSSLPHDFFKISLDAIARASLTKRQSYSTLRPQRFSLLP